VTNVDQRADLHARLLSLAEQFFEQSHTTKTNERLLREFLRDHASSILEFALQVSEEYVRVAGAKALDDEFPTPAQGIALARFLRPQFRDTVHPGERHAQVMRGGLGLPDSYIAVRLPTGYEGGIDREGNTST
jgi:hypothetical protein